METFPWWLVSHREQCSPWILDIVLLQEPCQGSSPGQSLALAGTEGRQSSPLPQPVGMGTERAQTSLFLHDVTEIILSTGDSQLSSLSWCWLPKSPSNKFLLRVRGGLWPQLSLSAPRRLVPFVDLPPKDLPRESEEFLVYNSVFISEYHLVFHILTAWNPLPNFNWTHPSSSFPVWSYCAMLLCTVKHRPGPPLELAMGIPLTLRKYFWDHLSNMRKSLNNT